jgi:ribosomal protein S18 acetylase RimI-like enzyme
MKETGYDYDPQLDADLSALEQEYIAPGGTIEVVKDGETIIGCIAVRKISEDVGEIKRLRLLSEYRGKGLGKELLDKALVFCVESGFKKAVLDTTKKNIAALKMFTDIGFIETKGEGDSIFLEKVFYKNRFRAFSPIVLFYFCGTVSVITCQEFMQHFVEARP